MHKLTFPIFFLCCFSITSFAQEGSSITIQENWLQAFNQKADMSMFYDHNSGLLMEDSLTTNPKVIHQRLLDTRIKIKKRSTYQTDEIHQIRSSKK